MADDIVTRLRTVDEFSDAIGIMDAAADEIERLRRWQIQATTVIENWDAVFDALIDAKPTDLGVSKSVLVAKEIIRLRCDNGELRTRIEELEEARRG